MSLTDFLKPPAEFGQRAYPVIGYALTPVVNLYARYATGYQAPSMARNFTDAVITLAKAQTTRSIEAGIKGSILAHRLNFSLTAYEWRTRNLQVTATTGGDNTIQLTNAKRAVGRGVEAEVDYRVTPRLSLSGSASYNFTAVRDAGLEVTPCGNGCTMLDSINPATGLARIDGNPLYNAPKWTLNGSASYVIPIGEDSVRLSTDWSYRSGIMATYYRAIELDMPSLLQGGARIAYLNKKYNVELSVFARNILDSVKPVNLYDLNTFAPLVNEPRIIGAGAAFRF